MRGTLPTHTDDVIFMHRDGFKLSPCTELSSRLAWSYSKQIMNLRQWVNRNVTYHEQVLSILKPFVIYNIRGYKMSTH